MQGNTTSRGDTPHDAPNLLRRRAATARRLARDVSTRDAERLQAIASELDARALALDAAEKSHDQHTISGRNQSHRREH
jgi:hypothetical protein